MQEGGDRPLLLSGGEAILHVWKYRSEYGTIMLRPTYVQRSLTPLRGAPSRAESLPPFFLAHLLHVAQLSRSLSDCWLWNQRAW